MHNTPDVPVTAPPSDACPTSRWRRVLYFFPKTVYVYEVTASTWRTWLDCGLIVALNAVIYTAVAWLAGLPITLTTRATVGTEYAETVAWILSFIAAAWAFRFGWSRVSVDFGRVKMGTCGELADFMARQPRDRLVVIQRDAESNGGHSPLAEVREAMYAAACSWQGRAYPTPEQFSACWTAVPSEAERVVVLEPTN